MSNNPIKASTPLAGRAASAARAARARAADAVDRAIAAIAGRQHGIVSREQLLALGLTSGEIQYRISIGRLHPIHSGVYAVGHLPISPHAYAYAAVLACGPEAALSHSSAAMLWRIAKEWQFPLEVTARAQRTHRRLRIHRSRTLTEADVTEHFGIRVTSPARTLFDNAPRLDDVRLGRALNDLRASHYLSLDDLFELLERHPPTSVTKRLRAHLAHPEEPPTRSELEDAFVRFAKRYGLPRHRINTGVSGREADIFFPEHRLVVEVDSWEYHRDRAQFESDRDRDATRLAAEIATVRVTWERMNLTPRREADRLLAILAQRSRGA
jgi:predicted transcriptional regulator of viral defense system